MWPDPKKTKYQARGKELRINLSIADSSPIKQRTFRNIFEHFDEQLEDWLKTINFRMLVDRNLGPIDSFIGGVDTKKFLRNYDEKKEELTFLDKSYELKPIVNEIKSILPKVTGKIKTP